MVTPHPPPKRKNAYFTEKIKELARHRRDCKSMMQRKGKRKYSLDPPEAVNEGWQKY